MDEQNIKTRSQSGWGRVSNLISIIFFPLFIPIYGSFLLFGVKVFSFYPAFYIIKARITVFLFGTIIPFFCILALYKLKIISDMALTRQRDRLLPYFLTFVSYVFCAFLLSRLAMPKFVYALMLAVAVALLINGIINIWWKISAHATGAGGFLGGILCVSYQNYINPLEWIVTVILICGAVAAARLYLKAHTPGQVIAGFLNGALCTLIIPNLRFGWLFF